MYIRIIAYLHNYIYGSNNNHLFYYSILSGTVRLAVVVPHHEPHVALGHDLEAVLYN